MLSFECPSVFFQCPEALSGSSGGRYTLLYITNGRRTGLLLIVRYHYNPLQRYAKRTEYQSLCLCFYKPMKSCLLLSCHLRMNGTAGSAVSAHTANCMTVFTVFSACAFHGVVGVGLCWLGSVMLGWFAKVDVCLCSLCAHGSFGIRSGFHGFSLLTMQSYYIR